MAAAVASFARRLMLPALLPLALLLTPASPPPANACGGPELRTLDTPLAPLSELNALLTQNPDEEAWDRLFTAREELLFLYPFKLLNPKEFKAVYESTYQDKTSGAPADPLAPMLAALRAGKMTEAQLEARKNVDAALNTPSYLADGYQQALARGVELLELAPALKKPVSPEILATYFGDAAGGAAASLPEPLKSSLELRTLPLEKAQAWVDAHPTHPRLASARFLVLRHMLQVGIPDGWASEIKEKVPVTAWQTMEKKVDAWLTDFPGHPLTDLVRLLKVRLAFFQQDADKAWKAGLAVYPNRMPRVTKEFHHLLMNGLKPSSALVDTLTDGPLIAGLVPNLEVTPAQWTRWWKLSEASSSASWAVNLQERLLSVAVTTMVGKNLPEGFPTEAKNPTPLWGKYRALALLKAERFDDAKKQLFSLQPDPEQTLLAAAYHIRRGDPATATLVIGLSDDIRAYLIRVILEDADLKRLETAKSEKVRKDVMLTQAVRLAGNGKWLEGAKVIEAKDKARADLWKKAAGLAARPDARLEYARFLKANHGKLFYGSDKVWYRSVNGRLFSVQWGIDHPEEVRATWELPWTFDQEKARVTKHFTESTENWLALQAYVDALEKMTPGPEMQKVVKEADGVYNWLNNWDSSNSSFWGQYLEKHPVAQRLRQQGKRARGK